MKIELMNDKEKELRQKLSAVRTQETFLKANHSDEYTMEEKEQKLEELKTKIKAIKKEFAQERISEIRKGK